MAALRSSEGRSVKGETISVQACFVWTQRLIPCSRQVYRLKSSWGESACRTSIDDLLGSLFFRSYFHFFDTALYSALLQALCLCSCALLHVGSVSPRKKKEKKNAKWCANQQCRILKPRLKMGSKRIWMAKLAPCAHVLLVFWNCVWPRLLSLACSLISSRQAVWRGLKAFTEQSPALINTHFLLEILAETSEALGD